MNIVIENSHNQAYFQKCVSHKGQNLDLINLSNREQHEICNKCLILNKYSLSSIVSVTDIKYADENTIITNFPPFEDENIHDFLSKQLYQIENETNQKINEIRDYFNTLSTNFHNTLKKVQVQTDKQIQSLIDLKQNIINIYNQISSKEQLQKIYQQHSESQSQQIHNIIKEKYDQIQTNTEKMQSSINQFNSIFKSINFNLPKQIQDLIIPTIEQIDFFQKNNQLNENNTKLNTQVIIDLINCKTNYCTEDYINQLNQILLKYDFLINQTKINCEIYDQQRRDSFQKLNEKQLENVRVLAQKVQIIDKEYEKENIKDISEKIQFNQQIFYCLHRYFGSLPNQIEQLIKAYPAFEQDYINYPILFKQINFIKTNYEVIQNLIISNLNGRLSILKSTKNIYGISYSNFIIDPKKKYIIRLQIQTNPNEYNPFILFGLIPDHQKDNSNLHDQGLAYNERSDYSTFNKIIKGDQVSSGKKYFINKEIELRFHLEDKFIRVASFPDYQNVSELDDKNRIIENTQYRFATELYQIYDRITITDFFIVDQFNDLM